MTARLPRTVPDVTERQLEVARLVAGGSTNGEIAGALGISLDGAKYHVSELLGRLGLQRREEIADWYRAQRGSVLRRALRALWGAPLAWVAGGGAVAVGLVTVVGVLVVGDVDEPPDEVFLVDPESPFVPAEVATIWRSGHETVLLADGRLLITGGTFNPAFEIPPVAEIYDPADGTITPVGAEFRRRSGHRALLLDDGRVLLAGGFEFDLEGQGSALRARGVLEIYDPEEDRASEVALRPNRSFGDAVRLEDGRVLITQASGARPGNDSKLWRAVIFDPGTDTIAEAGSTDVGGQAHQLVTLSGGRILLVSDVGAALFDPETGRFETILEYLDTELLPVFGELVALPDGRVLVAGGIDRLDLQAFADAVSERFEQDGSTGVAADLSVSSSARVAIIDVDERTLTDVSSMTSPRYGHALSVLSDGRVMIIGGLPGLGLAALSSSRPTEPEIYDWESNKYERLPLPRGLSFFSGSVTELPDGSIVMLFAVRSTVPGTSEPDRTPIVLRYRP